MERSFVEKNKSRTVEEERVYVVWAEGRKFFWLRGKTMERRESIVLECQKKS